MEEAHQLATDFLKTTDPSKKEFREKLVEVAGNSYFKTVEALYKNKAYDDALVRAENFLKLYPASKKRQSCLVLAGNAALALKDKKRALTYFSPLMNDASTGASTQGTALLTAGSVAEEGSDFESAATFYRKYLALPIKSQALDPAEVKGLRLKTLLLAWLSGQPAALKTSLNTPTVCTNDVAEDCDKFAGLLGLRDPGRQSDKAFTKRALERARKAAGPARGPWAALALENPKGVGFNERIQLFDMVSTDWEKRDALTRFALLPVISSSIIVGLRQANAEIRAMSKLKLEKPAIDKRTQLIQKMEAGVDKILSLPWARIRVGALGELANLYSDFSSDLAALPRPEGLAADDLKAYDQTISELRAPFQKKAEDLRKQALDLVATSPIETETYNPIAAAAQPHASLSNLSGPLAGIDTLQQIKAPAALVTLASKAVKEGNWGLLAFVIQEAKDKNLLNEGQLAAARGISLVLAGAQAEGTTELADAAKKLEKQAQLSVLIPVALAYYGVRAKDPTKAAIEQLVAASNESSRKALLKPLFAQQLAEAITWSAAQISNGTRQELAELGRQGRAPATPKGK